MRAVLAALVVLAAVAMSMAGPSSCPGPNYPPAPPLSLPFPNPIIVGLTDVRSNDGSWNNFLKPEMGMKGYMLRRTLASEFRDPLTPNPRVISNTLSDEPVDHKNTLNINMFESIFGQFLNHDRELSRNDNGTFLPVNLPGPGDALWVENATNNFILVQLSDLPTMKLKNNGPCETQIPNNSTAWLDLSALYGSDDQTVNAMRTFSNGLLKMSDYSVVLGPGAPAVELTGLLPSVNITGIHVDIAVVGSNTGVCSAGDPRVNENAGLALVTLIFLREHNRLAAQAKAAHSSWNDEKIFQWARKMNIAQYQHIVFDEYLPAIVNADHMKRIKPYLIYKRSEEGGTTIEFTHGAFRYGHSSVANYDLLDQDLCPKSIFIPAGIFGPDPYIKPQLPFAGQLGGFFQVPTAFALAGEKTILRGLLYNRGNEVDHLISQGLRSTKFIGATGAGLDLFVSDIVRGRLDGLSYYHDLRKKFFDGPSLPAGHANIYNHPDCTTNSNNPNEEDDLACFQLINPSQPDVATKLKSLYGKVNKIDGLVGLLSEEHLPGSFLPRTLANIVLDEYQQIRDADRFWYENIGALSITEKLQVKARSMAQIILDQYHSVEDPLVTNPGNLIASAFKVPPVSVGCCNAK